MRKDRGGCGPSTQVGFSYARCLAQLKVFVYVVLRLHL
jgi:hypothetical protein